MSTGSTTDRSACSSVTPSTSGAPLELHERFVRYERFDPVVPVWDVTPNVRGCFHRFFDTSPVSPSGRYLAVLQLPEEHRLNGPGEVANVLLVDLVDGTTKVVARTSGWEMQLGANLNWGASDDVLVFNDVDRSTWTPQLVRLNPHTGKTERTTGGVYHVSSDGRFAAAASLERMRRTQIGYGVLLPDEHVPVNIGAPDDDGLFITDLATGERKLVLPLSEAVKSIPEFGHEPLENWQIYGFHCKWSPRGDRLIFTVRRFRRDQAVELTQLQRLASHFPGVSHDHLAWDNINRGVLRYDVLTCRPDGSDVHNAVPASRWAKGGHHVNWYPDGEHLSMNLRLEVGGPLRLVRVQFDGVGLEAMTDTLGSGHPSVHPCGHVLSDTYAHEQPLAFGDGSVPLRWINPVSGEERYLVRMQSRVEPAGHVALRVDAHPAWLRGWRWIAFNGVADNTRHVYLADLSRVVDEAYASAAPGMHPPFAA